MRLTKVAVIYLGVVETTIILPSPVDQGPDDFLAMINKVVSQLESKNFFDIQCSYSNEVGLKISGKKEIDETDKTQIAEKLKDYQFPDDVLEVTLYDSAA